MFVPLPSNLSHLILASSLNLHTNIEVHFLHQTFFCFLSPPRVAFDAKTEKKTFLLIDLNFENFPLGTDLATFLFGDVALTASG